MGEGRGGRETFDVRPLMLDVLCRKDPSQFLSPVRAKDDSPREGCAAAALGNDPNNTSFFVIRPRERRMTKKAPLATTTLSHLLRSFLQIMLNVRGSRVHYFQPTLPTALRKTSPFFPVFVFVLGLALASLNVSAQSADDFFHTGAQAYLTNNTATAREQVDKGLKLYPNDIKLKKLDELLKQQKQQQQQQQNQKQNQSRQNQSQSKEDQQKQQDQKKQDEQKKQDQDKKDQQKQDQQNQKPEKQDEKQPQKQEPTPDEMTPDEAKKLLDSQKTDEKLLPANQKKQSDRKHLKDW